MSELSARSTKGSGSINKVLKVAENFRSSSLYLDEFIALMPLNNGADTNPSIQPLIARALSQVNGKEITYELESDIIEILNFEHINPRILSHPLGQYITHKYDLNNKSQEINLSDLATDSLLISCLKRFFFTHPKIEELLTSLRFILLQEIAQNLTTTEALQPLMQAIALNNHLNEYVHQVSATEREIIKSLVELIDLNLSPSTQNPTLSAITPVLAGLAMYQPLHKLKNRSVLLSLAKNEWPKILRIIAEETLFRIEEDLENEKNIPSLSNIDNEVSKSVQDQYEQNPYPRWTNIIKLNVDSAADYLEAGTQNYKAPKALKNNDINILIAGCGTGHHPITLAAMLPEATITAIDLSRKSLSYAQRKAKENNITNIKFFQGDILALDNLREKFDLIECVGVLHHMSSPITGWKCLQRLLKDDGVMKIALYSKIARREIAQQRDAIHQLELKPTETNIRNYRQALLERNSTNNIFLCRDFWALSECRDLLFHTQEHQLSWLEIDEICKEINMEVVAINTSQKTLEHYNATGPHSDRLKIWHEFELKNPNTFLNMYNFLCVNSQKI